MGSYLTNMVSRSTDWKYTAVKGLVTNYGEGGGGYKTGGGHVKFYPYEKGGGGGRTSFSHDDGGGGGRHVLG